jgi:hypothetical protein
LIDCPCRGDGDRIGTKLTNTATIVNQLIIIRHEHRHEFDDIRILQPKLIARTIEKDHDVSRLSSNRGSGRCHVCYDLGGL